MLCMHTHPFGNIFFWIMLNKICFGPFFERIGYDGERSQYKCIDLDVIYNIYWMMYSEILFCDHDWLTVHYLSYHAFSPDK